MNHHLKSLFVALMVTFSVGASGQLNYKSGYVITLKNDTLFGLINDSGGNRNAKVCLFKPDNESEALIYYPGDIKAYRFNEGKYFCSQELFIRDEYKYVFIDVLLKGKINLYHYRKSNEMAYYLEKEDGNLIGLLNKKAEVPISSEGLYGLQNKQLSIPVASEKFSNQLNTSIYLDIYKDTLFSVFKDSEKVQNQVDSVEYTQKSLIKITKSYLNETCFEIDCITYEKDLSLSKPSFGLFSGVTLSKFSFLDSDAKSDIIASIPIGVFCNFPLRQINDGLSFQIEAVTNGFNYSRNFSGIVDTFSYIVINTRTIGFPLLLKYQISGKKLSPSFAIGKETGFVINSDVTINYYDDLVLHKTQKGGWFYEAGVNYKIGPHFSLFSNIRYQSYSNLILSKDYSNRSSYFNAVYYNHYLKRYKTNTLTLHIGIKF